jgi:hypothetical protein
MIIQLEKEAFVAHNPLIKKLQIKRGQRMIIINPPVGYIEKPTCPVISFGNGWRIRDSGL